MSTAPTLCQKNRWTRPSRRGCLHALIPIVDCTFMLSFLCLGCPFRDGHVHQLQRNHFGMQTIKVASSKHYGIIVVRPKHFVPSIMELSIRCLPLTILLTQYRFNQFNIRPLIPSDCLLSDVSICPHRCQNPAGRK